MHFSTLLLSTFATLALAQNPFSFTTLPTSIPVGTPFNITWSPSTGTTDTVTLLLRQGDPNALVTVETIASKIQNTGSYLWTPTSALVNGPLYAFEIVDDGNDVIVNYSGQFAISSPNTVSSTFASTGSASASVTSLGSSAASALTGSATATATGTSTSGSATKSASATSGSSSASKTTSSASATETTAAPSGNAAVRMGVSGGMLAVVGAFMAAL